MNSCNNWCQEAVVDLMLGILDGRLVIVSLHVQGEGRSSVGLAGKREDWCMFVLRMSMMYSVYANGS